ncbi:aminopeptidase [Actinoplanes sp. TBRC 11911]|uniref:aminopeptidase n=1 Tax=Actinoplanes sp. TBRC 11911 TaxID=2729386 RepID=UPI00145EA944|nr:aminopeptidase [Actinoplanes sp. TBRC 11911]NMO51352.1 aminopeptidase [Actinoplanes sp. TBRC 11911]
MGMIERFANLVVRGGVNVQPGQLVVIETEIAHVEVARAVVDAAYAAGAGYVEMVWSDGPIHRATLEHATAETLSASRRWALTRIEEWNEAGIARINLIGDPYPHLFDGIDPVKLAAKRTEEVLARRKGTYQTVRWTAAAVPDPGWAGQIFGEPDTERLWEAVATAMRLDGDDPVKEWQERAATLAARAKQLDELDLDEVRYLGEGTDLTVGLVANSRWTGGGLTDEHGVAYLPNIPTEEVFTSPDRRRAEGTIRLTKPLVLNGKLVEGLRATFRDGRITEVTADANADVVRAQLDLDESARHLGEVSLVDRDSRIAKAGIVFHNTLFDENAGCHVAWGQSFPFAVEGGFAMTPEQRAELGLNNAPVHTDVVIGGDGITVTGRGPKGTVTIISDDDWVL